MSAPTVGRERRRAIICGLLVLLVAVGLILTTGRHSVVAASERARPTQTATRETNSRWTAQAAAETKATAETFLAGYLAYLYGHAPASQVKDGTGAFVRALEGERLHVPPGIRALHARVVGIDVSPQAPGHAVAGALVSDAEVVRYPIRLILTQAGGRWRVSGLEQAP